MNKFLHPRLLTNYRMHSRLKNIQKRIDEKKQIVLDTTRQLAPPKTFDDFHILNNLIATLDSELENSIVNILNLNIEPRLLLIEYPSLVFNEVVERFRKKYKLLSDFNYLRKDLINEKSDGYILRNISSLGLKDQESLAEFIKNNIPNDKLILAQSSHSIQSSKLSDCFRNHSFRLPDIKNFEGKISKVLYAILLNQEKYKAQDEETSRLLIEEDMFSDLLSSVNSLNQLVETVQHLPKDNEIDKAKFWYDFENNLDIVKNKMERALRISSFANKKDVYSFIKQDGLFSIIYNGKQVLLKKNDYEGFGYLYNIIKYGHSEVGIEIGKLVSMNTKNYITNEESSFATSENFNDLRRNP